MKCPPSSPLIHGCVAASLLALFSNAEEVVTELDKPETVTAKIHRSLPPFTIEMDLLEPCLANVRISGGALGFKGQSFKAAVVRNYAAAFAKDVNFDGYKDIRISSDWGGHGLNDTVCWWVYDKDRHLFVRDHEFDEINEVDAKQGLLIHGWDYGGGNICYDYYRLFGRKLVLVKTTRDDWPRSFPDLFSDDDLSDNRYRFHGTIRVTRIYQNGRNVRTFYKQIECH
jgi:hypothetical protein